MARLGAALRIDSPVGFGMALAAIGFFSRIYHPAGLGLISKEMQHVSVGMGFNGMFGNLGPAADRFCQLVLGPPSGIFVFGVGALAVKMAAFIETTAGIGAIFPALGFTSFILVAVIVLLIFKT